MNSIVNVITGTTVDSIIDIDFKLLADILKEEKKTLSIKLKEKDCEVVIGLEDNIPIFIIDLKKDVITGAILTNETDKTNFIEKSIENDIDDSFIQRYKGIKLNSLIYHSSLDLKNHNEITIELITLLLLTLKTKFLQ